MRIKVTAVLVILAAQTMAQDAPNLCHALNNAVERLQCYDDQTGFQIPKANLIDPASNASQGDAGLQWVQSVQESAMHNRKDVWLSVVSENGQNTSYGRDKNARLGLRCMDNKTSIYLEFDTYINEPQNVLYKIDDNKIRSIYMQTFTSKDGLGIFRGGKSIPFIKSLFDKNKIIFQFRSYRNPSLEFVFNISGLRNQITELSKACEWTP